MDSDEIDEFDLAEIEAALYAKVHHEVYEETEESKINVEPVNEIGPPAIKDSSSLPERSRLIDKVVGKAAIKDHVEIKSKYSVKASHVSTRKSHSNLNISDSDSEVVCLDLDKSKTEIVISSDSDSEIECTSDMKDILSQKPVDTKIPAKPESDKKKKSGLSSVYKKMDDSPLTLGQLKHLNVHYAYNGEGTEVFQKNKKIRFSSESDEDLISSKNLPELKTNLSLNIRGSNDSNEEHEEMMRKIDDIVNQSVFLGAGESSPRIPKTWTSDMKNFYDGTENVPDLTTIVKKLPKGGHLWEIDPVDKYGNRGKNRYFSAVKGRCNNCNQIGHFIRNCPDPIRPIVCNMCGNVGHQHFQCRLSMCLQCGSKTREFQEMCSGCRHEVKLKCSICKLRGHLAVRCPDIWRRYHISISADYADTPLQPSRPLVVKAGNCCNCGSRYHSAISCPIQRESLLPIHTTNTIHSYANPLEHFQSGRLFLQSQARENETPKWPPTGTEICVHYKFVSKKAERFSSLVFDEVKEIWPNVTIGECPKNKVVVAPRGKKFVHIFAPTAKLKNQVCVYLKNAFRYLVASTDLNGNKAVKQSGRELLYQSRQELLRPTFKQSSMWQSLISNVKEEPAFHKASGKKNSEKKVKVKAAKTKNLKAKSLFEGVIL